MARKSPLTSRHLHNEAQVTAYPDPADPADEARAAEVVEAFGPIELEYAAARKGCVLADQSHRGTVIVRGGDRVEFLNRMLTQELKDLEPWRHRPSFWLNRKGRIDADLRVCALPEEIRFDLDVHRAAHTVETLSSYLFAEDVGLTDATETHHRLALHGPTAIMLLAAVAEHTHGPKIEDLREGQACAARAGDAEILIERRDWLGEIGLEITCETDLARGLYERILDAGSGESELAQRARCRPAGWHACNIARIEAGTPLYFLDYDEQNLPHESGILHSRVSFKKGCYLGQEVVARMEARGQSKQRLVALRVKGHAGPEAPLPVMGAELFAEPDAEPGNTKPVGEMRSSTLSPLLGMTPIGLAMVRTAHAEPGATLHVVAEGRFVEAEVQPELASRPAPKR